ncbi:hypothetical protein M942_24215 [Enterobacter ludwigii]|nr:hypothetical protein M942_24215 [Enterobacter ludwigii]
MRLQPRKRFTFKPCKANGYQDAPSKVSEIFGRTFRKSYSQTALQIVVLMCFGQIITLNRINIIAVKQRANLWH